MKELANICGEATKKVGISKIAETILGSIPVQNQMRKETRNTTTSFAKRANRVVLSSVLGHIATDDVSTLNNEKWG